MDLDAGDKTGKGALHLLYLPGRQHPSQGGYDLAHRRRQHVDARRWLGRTRSGKLLAKMIALRLSRHHLRLQVLDQLALGDPLDEPADLTLHLCQLGSPDMCSSALGAGTVRAARKSRLAKCPELANEPAGLSEVSHRDFTAAVCAILTAAFDRDRGLWYNTISADA